jgi:hypothetical protein
MPRLLQQSPLLLLVGLGLLGLLLGFGAATVTMPRQPIDRPVPPAGAGDEASQDQAAGKWALLVGVTRYDHLPEGQHLSGPGNDARLMRQLLQTRFGFPADHVTTLAEGVGADRRPTRANIERGFRRLADAAQAGDQVVVFLAGHGARQPESDPPDPKYPEPDGIDEIFLPADAGEWKGLPERVPNAVVDDDLRVWLEALTRKRAHVWAIFDCCHSGHMTRGTEIVREVPLVPAEELRRASERAAQRGDKGQRGSAKPAPFVPPEPSDYLVALYACRPHETTPESLFPPDNTDAKYHGLLTYTLVQVLEQAAESGMALTYRDLVQRIGLKYAARPQGAPTPTVEGGGQDRVVLGTERLDQPRLTLRRSGGRYRVNAGDLHGLTPNSILAVYSPIEATKPELLGHVRVTSAGPFDAVVEPCAHAGRPEPRDLPELARCAVVFTDCTLRGFKVAVQAAKSQEAAKERVLKALGPLEEQRISLVRAVDNPRVADWLIRLDGAAPELVEASGNRRPYRLPPTDSPDFAEELRKALGIVYRARSLLAVAERLQRERASSEVDIAVEVVQRRGEGEVPRSPDGWVFRPGDRVSFRLHNKSLLTRVDVSLLIVNPDLKITAFYPPKNEIGKTLGPGEMWETYAGKINEKPPFGPEYLVALAVPARNPPVDFSLLTQEGLRRGMERFEVGNCAVRVLSWRTEPLP